MCARWRPTNCRSWALTRPRRGSQWPGSLRLGSCHRSLSIRSCAVSGNDSIGCHSSSPAPRMPSAQLPALLHVYNGWSGLPVPSVLGMRVLTYTFVASVVPLAALTRGQPGGRRALWIAALAAFTVSALHLGQLHRGDASWPVELLGHHASIPLALAILYQDYPFALADLFLKRALTLLILIAAAFVGIATFGLHAASSHSLVRLDPGELGILVSLWVATALAAPAIRRASSWFVDTVVLRRPDFGQLRAAIARHAQERDSIPDLLGDACDLLAPAMSARSVDVAGTLDSGGGADWFANRPHRRRSPAGPAPVER